MKKLLFASLIILSSCTVQKINKSLNKSDVFNKGHLGFMLVDPAKDKVLVDINSDKYFIPASNTKLFTFYTSYTVLGDSLINGLNYIEKSDSLIFWGTGDPSLLHPDLKNTVALDFLKSQTKSLYLLDNFDQVDAFGPGWSWDWYNAYYSAERSSLPIYGDIVRFAKDEGDSTFTIYPPRFKSSMELTEPNGNSSSSFRRDHLENKFKYYVTSEATHTRFETDIPFITSADFTAQLLSEELGKKITVLKNSHYVTEVPKKLLTASADSIY